MADPKIPHGVAGAPNEAALLSLMERTSYQMIQENGQRKYGGPPPGWDAPTPCRGCEVFVGKIPRDCYEDELVPIFEKIGQIYELRLMMDFSGANRGYCFVMYSSRDEAKRAVKDLNNFQIRKGRYLGVCQSVDNCRLFVGGIPKNKTKDEILVEMKKVTEGVQDVIVYPSATDKTKNRGFAFVEFESHRAAAMARRKLIPGRIQLWGHTIAVDWAEPEQDVDEDIMSKVKILYVRNLMLSTSEETLERVFNQSTGKENAVERVKKLRDYAFVHFRDRDDCLRSLQALDGTNIEGSMVEVCLAKPVDKNDYVRYTRNAGASPGKPGGLPQLLSDFESPIGKPKEGMVPLQPYTYPGLEAAATAAYAGVPYYPAAAASLNPGAAALASRMSMFPDAAGVAGRAHLQALQRGAAGGARGRGRGAAGSRGAGGVNRAYPNYMRGQRKGTPEGENFYDIVPGMELTPTNPITLKPQNAKTPTQTLDEVCQKNGWGSPVYQLHSTIGRDSTGDIQLFLFKVSIPALTSQYPNSTFQPNKLCRTVDEAKHYAAEYVLSQLGISIEGADHPSPCASSVSATSMISTSPPPMSVTPTAAAASVAAAAAIYQGRPIAPAYSLQSVMPTLATMPLMSSAAQYVMSPGKLTTPPLAQSYPAFATYAQY